MVRSDSTMITTNPTQKRTNDITRPMGAMLVDLSSPTRQRSYFELEDVAPES